MASDTLDEFITLELTGAELALITQAAATLGVTVEAFVLQAAVAEATTALATADAGIEAGAGPMVG